MKFSFYQKPHLIALTAAILVHGSLAAVSMLPSNPIVINQQTIQVSFVAPSSANKKSKSEFSQKIALNVESENAIKQKKVNQVENAESNTEKNLSAGKQTSGREDPNAIATKAAESDPVFNAAYLNNPAPAYPTSAKRRGTQGKVLLSVVVKTDGTAAAVLVSHSSGSSDLDEAALTAVKQWKFIPARSRGEFVQANVLVPIEFKIV